MGLGIKQLIFEESWHVRVVEDLKDPKNGQKYWTFSNHISKGSRGMFARQPDYANTNWIWIIDN